LGGRGGTSDRCYGTGVDLMTMTRQRLRLQAFSQGRQFWKVTWQRQLEKKALELARRLNKRRPGQFVQSYCLSTSIWMGPSARPLMNWST
jgi:hypothetical protein